MTEENKPQDAMTSRELNAYTPKKTNMLKRGYSITETDELFRELTAILGMYEEGSYVNGLLGKMITAEDLTALKLPRSTNGYEMKEVNRVIERAKLALEYFENDREVKFDMKKKKASRKVNIDGEIVDASIDSFDEEEEVKEVDTTPTETVGMFAAADAADFQRDKDDETLFGSGSLEDVPPPPSEDEEHYDSLLDDDDISNEDINLSDDFEAEDEEEPVVEFEEEPEEEEEVHAPAPSERYVPEYEYDEASSLPEDWRAYV